jgi:hypothetical protein
MEYTADQMKDYLSRTIEHCVEDVEYYAHEACRERAEEGAVSDGLRALLVRDICAITRLQKEYKDLTGEYLDLSTESE